MTETDDDDAISKAFADAASERPRRTITMVPESRLAGAEARGFARAVQALEELAPSITWAARAAEHLRGVASLAPPPPVSDPEEAARERLGKWLAASPFVRTVRRQLHGKPGEISVRVELRAGSGASARCFVGAWCPSDDEAITAALDAAEATEGK